jgi:hypothetical protein
MSVWRGNGTSLGVNDRAIVLPRYFVLPFGGLVAGTASVTILYIIPH